MREPQPHWIAQLRQLEGCGEAAIRWNNIVGRWEFVLPSADGKARSQFWGQFWVMKQGKRVRAKIDPVTGLYPFRELDDAAMQEAIQNLTVSYIANPHDGAGTTFKEVSRRIDDNMKLRNRKYLEAGEAWADMAAERGRRLRGGAMEPVLMDIGKRATPTQGASV